MNGNGVVILYDPGDNDYATSTDGTSWTNRTFPASGTPGVIFFSNSLTLFIYADTANERIYTSSNAISWSNVASIPATYDQMFFQQAGDVIVGTSSLSITGECNYALTSVDGSTWTKRVVNLANTGEFLPIAMPNGSIYWFRVDGGTNTFYSAPIITS